MTKYKIIMHTAADGDYEDDNYGDYYDSYDRAQDEAEYSLSCTKTGAEILHLSNPGDYPYSESMFEGDSYEIVEVDEDEISEE